MAYTAPSTQVTGYLVTASDYNTDIINNIIALHGFINDYILIRDEKAANTDGGTFTSGAWQTRDLNTEVTDVGGHASVASNQITLASGTYECYVIAPAAFVNGHMARLQNITDGTTIQTGTTQRSAAGTSEWITSSIVQARFTIAASKVLEVQHQCQTTRATTGFGDAANLGTNEVYTQAMFRRIGE